MTREAKIGMLTGLGVIVLIGVLLSEYLGDAGGSMLASVAGSSTNNTATGRMAPLPIGATYRQQLMEPAGAGSVTVPGMGRPETPGPGNEMVLSNVTPAQVIPPAFASQRQMVDLATGSTVPVSTGPMVSQPVTPVAVGPSPMESQAASGGAGLPTISVNDAPAPQHVDALTAISDALMGKKEDGKVAGTMYVIASGDNLAKIAKKFYGSTKNSDVQRIVAANPTVLKDAGTPLIAGKKIVIPTAGGSGAKPAATPGSPGKSAAALAKKTEPVMIYMPGDLAKDSPAKPQAKADDGKAADSAASRKDAPRTYVVQAGDTLEKIARKLAPSKVTQTVDKLKTANNIKDVHGLQVGMKLKLPA